MISGSAALGEINQTLARVRRDFNSLDNIMQSSSSALTRNQLQQTRVLRALASDRLERLDSGKLASSVDSADTAASEVLLQRERALANLAQKLHEGGEALEQAERQRDSLHVTVDAAAQELAELEAEVQRLLEADEGYQQQLETAYEARAIATQAEEKTALAEKDRKEKGLPYESSKLFSYLWGRHYGTSQYRGSGLFAAMDDWVAGLCDYDKARANYWLLLEIPRRLAEHARIVNQRAEAELGKLQELETKVANAAGVDLAQQALEEAESEQDVCDANIDEIELSLGEVQDHLNRFASGEDDFTKRCLDGLEAAYSARDMDRLESMVMATASRSDDEMVRELIDLRQEQRLIREEINDNKQLHKQHSTRLKDLEDVRRRFKRHRFDDLRSSFGSENIIRMVLDEFLRGAVRGSGVWDTLKRQQRYRDVGGAWPDFGSGSLPRGSRGSSPWHWPGGRGGFRMPRRGGSMSRGGSPRRRSSGGFRTGGGF